jgi:hypothetical protein
MFLRQHHRSKNGKEHGYWSLVETVRTPGTQALKRLSELYSVDIVLPTVDGRDLFAKNYQAGGRSGKANQSTSPGVAGTFAAHSDPEM